MPGNDETTIQSLSNASLSKSLSYLPMEDLLNARAVSHRFEQAALADLKQRGLRLVDVAAGMYRTIALMQDKQGRQQLFAWGDNKDGQLGLGDNVNRNTPQALDMGFLPKGAQITQVVAGHLHILIQVRTDAGESQLFAWGYDWRDQLGLGDNVNRNTPQALDMGFLPKGAQITQVVAGHLHILIQVQTEVGESQLFAWGWNWSGQLGLGDNIGRNTPQQLCLGPFKSVEPLIHQLSVGQTERRLARLERQRQSQTAVLSRGLRLGLGVAVGVSLFQSRESQLTGSLIAAGLLGKAQSKALQYRSKAHQRRRKKAAIACHDESVNKKQGRHYQLGLKSATSKCSYVLSYFKVCGKKENKEWHAGYAAGLLEEETRKQRLKLKQQ